MLIIWQSWGPESVLPKLWSVDCELWVTFCDHTSKELESKLQKHEQLDLAWPVASSLGWAQAMQSLWQIACCPSFTLVHTVGLHVGPWQTGNGNSWSLFYVVEEALSYEIRCKEKQVGTECEEPWSLIVWDHSFVQTFLLGCACLHIIIVNCGTCKYRLSFRSKQRNQEIAGKRILKKNKQKSSRKQKRHSFSVLESEKKVHRIIEKW
jgi:hypothetical protein